MYCQLSMFIKNMQKNNAGLTCVVAPLYDYSHEVVSKRAISRFANTKQYLWIHNAQL
jgi:hypothetical protein